MSQQTPSFLQRARQARERIGDFLRPTPLIPSRVLSERAGCPVWLKLESQNPTGAFKVRPAFNGILSHLKEARADGVLTTSSGNYAQAVAYASRLLDVRATIVMTEDTAPLKVERTRALGAKVVFCGPSFESRFQRLEELKQEQGGLVLHPFDSEETISGNGTLALELMDADANDFAVLCPASGGGLIAGIARTLKEPRPTCKIFGFQPELGGAIYQSLRKGERVSVGKSLSIADALVAATPGEMTFPLIQKYVEDFYLVTEEEIRAAMRFLFDEQKLVVEPGAAVGVAGLIAGKCKPRASSLICVITGGNVSPQRLQEILTPLD